jgi:transcriptional regulator with XRE-family HTH domain
MCDIRTMGAVESWGEVGERVRQARVAHQLSQAELAHRLGIDRSALVRVEGGTRQISALELFHLAELLGVPVAHFVSKPPPAVVSRRQELTDDADHITRARFRMDAALEAHARDAEWLREEGFLSPSKLAGAGVESFVKKDRPGDPKGVARTLRAALHLGEGPIASMADACGRAGLHLLVVPDLEAGASLLLDEGLGVAVIGGDDQPGRRRLTAAHELGHYVLQDEYTTDIGVAASRDEREQRIDAFATEFLLPAERLHRVWTVQADQSIRRRLVWVSGTYRVSWSVSVRGAAEAELLDDRERADLLSRLPQRGEFLDVLGFEPPQDLTNGQTSPEWRRAVLRAWQAGAIVASRAVELLHDVIAESDLPEREESEPA